ncbi:hypothetical protein MBUL_00066 [Methylobacterium bullatum]|uniref:DUF4258 domain-containing protein n=1 Tax=Methylobacterium bullatum TaxID=570505 RepID=A0A679IV26_9HYPH|nr:hypothetical protein MBUL_00066 [Methylobacterium bullatum]
MKPIVFIDHADQRLARRGLDREWIERTIRQPDFLEPDPDHPERVRAYRSLPECDGRVLRVIYEDASVEIQVITAFLDRNRTRRLNR